MMHVLPSAGCTLSWLQAYWLIVTSHIRSAVPLQRRFTRERVAALLEDRSLREADAAAHAAAADAKLANLTARLTDAEMALQQITKDHILGAGS